MFLKEYNYWKTDLNTVLTLLVCNLNKYYSVLF